MLQTGNANWYLMITEDMSSHGFDIKDMSSLEVFHKSYVEIILTSFFTIPLRDICLGLYDTIKYSFKLLVDAH